MADKSSKKNGIYEYTSLVGKALSSPSRLHLLDLLCQGKKSVEMLAEQAGLNVKITSAHLKTLKAARLVESVRDGRFIYYRVADDRVSDFFVKLRNLAHHRFLEVQKMASEFEKNSSDLYPFDRKTLLKQAKNGDVIVIDVRPNDEYTAAHLPYARSIPLSELKKHLSKLDSKKEIVAYCRGPYCVLSHDAVKILRKKGFRATRVTDGVTDWQAAGLPIETA